MKSLGEIKTEKEEKMSALIKDCLMFFAFSNEQFNENKTPLLEGEKYVHIGMGSYLPKGKVEAFRSGMQEINTWYKESIKDSKLRKENIEYELSNHESYYTGDIENALESLGSDYSREEVRQVYKETKEKHLEFS